MEIVHTVINDIVEMMRMDKDDAKLFRTAVSQCEAMGFVHINELRQLTEAGIPVFRIAIWMLRAREQDVSEKFKNREIAYQDLICILAIWAQNLMVRTKYVKNPLIATAECNHYSVDYLKKNILDMDRPLDEKTQRAIDKIRDAMHLTTESLILRATTTPLSDFDTDEFKKLLKRHGDVLDMATDQIIRMRGSNNIK